MDGTGRKFRLQKTRCRDRRIVDVYGRTGYWPFDQPISYHVGINCDAIHATDGRLVIVRHGEVIAYAELSPEVGTTLREPGRA